MYLVKAFVDVDRPTGEGGAGDLAALELDGGLVPAVGRAKARNAREHKGIAPSAHPGVEVAEAGRGPSAVEAGEDEENTISHGIGEVGGVLWQVGGFGMKGA